MVCKNCGANIPNGELFCPNCGTCTENAKFCKYCGAVIDLPHLTLDSEMDHAVSQQYGLMVYRHELTLHGLCPDCIKQKKSKEETRS